MRRRRPFGRKPIRPIPGGRPIGDGPRRHLRRAHQLMETGKHTEAAAIFERLARGAYDRGMLHHAPNLFLQASRANLLAGQTEKGMELLKYGLNIIVKAKRWNILARAGQRAVGELNQLGHAKQAEEIETWLQATLPEPIEKYQKQIPSAKKLPLKCPYCGGVLKPGEVEMLDADTGECPFCGSAVRGE